MPFNRLKLAGVIFILSLLSVTHAAEHGGGGEEGAKEGEGESAKAADSGTKEQREYLTKSSKLKTLATRIEDTEKEFQDLVHQKSVNRDPEALQEILAQMVDASKRRNKAVDDYNKLKMDLDLRYPNQGQQESRQYQTQNKKTVEELEGVAGLDELLTRTKKIVEKKFAAFDEPDPLGVKKARKAKAKAKAGPQEPGAEDDEPKRLRLEH
jgi:hypothetical protein